MATTSAAYVRLARIVCFIFASTNAPPGLRFSHLLVSDVLATFDETLLHMKQVQEHEAEKSEPQWLVLTPVLFLPHKL